MSIDSKTIKQIFICKVWLILRNLLHLFCFYTNNESIAWCHSGKDWNAITYTEFFSSKKIKRHDAIVCITNDANSKVFFSFSSNKPWHNGGNLFMKSYSNFCNAVWQFGGKFISSFESLRLCDLIEKSSKIQILTHLFIFWLVESKSTR